MTFVSTIGVSLVFLLLTYLLVIVRSRRQVVAIALAGILLVTVAAPPKTQASSGLVTAIQAVLKVINAVIHSTLKEIDAVRAEISKLYQKVIWPVALINEARAMTSQMTSRFRGVMQAIIGMDLRSATLPNTIALETVLRNHQTSDFAALTNSYGNTYGALPAPAAASQPDRAAMDLDDALALDSLKALKEAESASDLTLTAANNIESAASAAAPGSAPFLTASAAVANLQSEAVLHRILAAELRQAAIKLAHQNALRKRGTAASVDVNTQILNLLRKK